VLTVVLTVGLKVVLIVVSTLVLALVHSCATLVLKWCEKEKLTETMAKEEKAVIILHIHAKIYAFSHTCTHARTHTRTQPPQTVHNAVELDRSMFG
jgi:hypothetical protein